MIGQIPGRGPGSIPPWFKKPTLATRLAAWVLDLATFGVISAIPLAVAVLTGALGIEPEAARQLDRDPSALPTVPYLVIRAEPLAAIAVVWVLAAVVYAAMCWVALGASIGQRTQSLVVVDARTGGPLPLGRAIRRAILVAGIPAGLFAASLFGICQVFSIVPANMTDSATRLSQPDVLGWTQLMSWTGLLGSLWCAALLMSVAAAGDGRGAHDRLSGSTVLRRVSLVSPAAQGIWWPSTSVPPYPLPAGQTPPGPGPQPGGGSPVGDGDGQPVPTRPAYWTGLAGGEQPEPEEPDRSIDSTTADDGSSDAARRTSVGRTGPLGSKLPEGLRVAAFRRRAAAFSLDTIVVLVMYSAIEAAVAPVNPAGEVPEKMRMVAGFIGGFAQLLYFVGCWWVLKGSIGQRLLGVEVVRESGVGRIGPMDSLVRWAALQGPLALMMAAPNILGVLLLVASVGWIVLLGRSAQLDPDARGYHDRIAGSLVVEPIQQGPMF